MPRSPKGLIENRSVTPEEMAQLGIRLEQIGCLDVDQKIKNSIAYWKWFVGLHIEANPAIDGTLDRTASAKAIIAKLQIIEYFLAEAEPNAASGNLYVAALDQALSFARDLYEFAIIDNETPIAARQESIKGARNGGRLRSKGVKPRNREMAQAFQNRRGGNLSDTALMEQIGLGEGLKKRASINAVKSGLEDLRDAPTEIGGASDDDDHTQPALPLALPRRAGRSPRS